MTGTHNQALVALSVLLAITASYTALDLASRVRASTGIARHIWLGTAALAMGGGIWAMHFVAMLAFSMPGMTVTYDAGETLLSLLIPILATAIGFTMMNQAAPSYWRLGASGLCMGAGIVLMHYIGMAAMQMPATLQYSRNWVGVSVLIAIGAATAGLWLSSHNSHLPVRAASAAIMGFAIAGMHYAAMQGLTFNAMPDMAGASNRASLSQMTLAAAVSVSTLIILFLALLAAMFDRRFAEMAAREARALRLSEQRFRSLYRHTPLPLHSLDGSGAIEEVTEAWLALMGYERRDVVGRPLINFMTEASARQAIQSDWPRLLDAGQMTEIEYRFVTRDGRFLDVVASARVEHDENGNFTRALGGLADVTDRKLAEEALHHAKKMEAIGQLTGGVAHDFNNLLAVIMGNLELLRKRVSQDEKLVRLVDNAQQGAQRGAALTQRMLAFARRQDLVPEPVDLPELVQGMAELLQGSLGKSIRIETRFPLGIPHALVDANQLELALLNLAVNARDAMPDGGTLTITGNEQTVGSQKTAGLPSSEYVCLSISDTGTGMDEATLARATEPFFTTKGVGKGTGLGLSMAHGLAAQSGGRLTIQSQFGMGTTISLWLPATYCPSRSHGV